MEENYDVFENDLFAEGDSASYPTIGRWGVLLLHLMKGAFVIYSGAHNIQAAITATGSNTFAVVAQIIGVLVLEITITALYMAGMAGKITGKLQALVAALFWSAGMFLASAGIVADSRLHAGYELGDLLSWHLETGLFIAPVIMVIGTVLVVFTDPVLTQKIANARDRATIERQRVRATVLADRAAHESRKIIHNIRLGAQKQMAIEARNYYKSDEVQEVLRQTAVVALQDVMRQAGIDIPATSALEPGQVARVHQATTPGQPTITPIQNDNDNGLLDYQDFRQYMGANGSGNNNHPTQQAK